MTNEDFAELQRLAPHLSEFRRVGVFSPREGEHKLFPRATSLPEWRWDLNKPNKHRWDLLIASSVFMYSKNPALWFQHVFASCKYFLLLDLVRRRRSAANEFAPDGDSMRYAIGDARPRIESGFDLDRYRDRLLGYRTFFGGANEHDDAAVHLLALFRGDLADPLVRVDDYPTGVRPILSDLRPLHDVLLRIEQRRLTYHLGIVPALLTEEMVGFLRSLTAMIPEAHGYDHAYPKYAPVLIAKGDPLNQRRTVGGSFNEFQGQPYDTILTRLREGRGILERLGKPVEGYIPPCNRADRATGRALVEAGYRYVLSDRPIPGCALPRITSDFSGLSSQYDYDRRPDVLALHVTWECDLARQGAGGDLDRLLDHLAGRRDEERRRGARLGALVSGTT